MEYFIRRYSCIFSTSSHKIFLCSDHVKFCKFRTCSNISASLVHVMTVSAYYSVFWFCFHEFDHFVYFTESLYIWNHCLSRRTYITVYFIGLDLCVFMSLVVIVTLLNRCLYLQAYCNWKSRGKQTDSVVSDAIAYSILLPEYVINISLTDHIFELHQEKENTVLIKLKCT